MRFMGLVGMLVLLGIAFVLSNNKKSIRPRVILWGTGLQALFAIIILSESLLSWIGMVVFLFLIELYLLHDTFFRDKTWIQALPTALITFVSTCVLIGLAFLLDKIGLSSFLLAALVLGIIVLSALKRFGSARFFFGAAMAVGLGMFFQRGIYGKDIFAALADKVDRFLKLTDLGTEFLFGNLAKPEFFDQFGVQFAFAILPTIIFFSAFMSILYYMGVMQFVVQIMARFMRWTMGTSGAETLSCSANIFVGQTEAPLLIKPFLDDMTESELHAIMVGGFATIAGGVLAGYIRMGVNAGHLIAASVMSAPAALVMAKIIMPETQHSKTAGDVQIPDVGRADNLLDAAARGVTDGLKLAVNVGAMHRLYRPYRPGGCYFWLF